MNLDCKGHRMSNVKTLSFLCIIVSFRFEQSVVQNAILTLVNTLKYMTSIDVELV